MQPSLAAALIRFPYGISPAKVRLDYLYISVSYDEYIQLQALKVREATLNKTRRRFELHILPKLADIRLTALNPRIMQDWKLSVDPSLKPETKKGFYAELRAILNYAVRMEYIPRNPLLSVGNFSNSYERKSGIDFYTPDEFKQFIAAAETAAEKYEVKHNSVYEWNYYIFFMIAFYAGLRKGEIFALRWSDIKDGIISVSRSVNQKLKGDDRETLPKTKSSVRTLQMPRPLSIALEEHKSRYSQLDGFNDDWHICGGEKCIRDTTVGIKNTEYSTAAGIKHIRIHDFRHSHASVLANNGINIQEIARRLGHGDVQTTWRVYAHLYPQEEERAISILNNLNI